MPKQQINLGRNWYVIHTYSGYEDAVARSLKQRIESLQMQDKIFNVLVPKEKKIKDVTTDNILNRFKEKGFAKGANREIIKKCESLLNLSLNEFVSLVLQGMQKIDKVLGL